MTNRNTENKVDEQISDLALDAVVGGTSIKKIGGVAWDQLKSSAHMFLGGSEEILGELVGQFTFIPGAHERGTEWTHTGEGRWMEGVKEGQQASHLEGDDAATTILGTFLSTAAGAGIGELGGTIIGKVTDPMLSSVYERLTDGATGVPEAAPPNFSQIDGQINDVLSNLDEGSGLGHEHEAILRKLNESSVERLRNLLNNEAKLDIRMANDEADHLAGNAGDEHRIQSLREHARALEANPPGQQAFAKLQEVYREQPPNSFRNADDLLDHIVRHQDSALAHEVGLSNEVIRSYLVMKIEIVALTKETIEVARQEILANASGNHSGLGAALDHSAPMDGHDLGMDNQHTHEVMSDTTRFDRKIDNAEHAMNHVVNQYDGVANLRQIPEMEWNHDIGQLTKANDDLLHAINGHIHEHVGSELRLSQSYHRGAGSDNVPLDYSYNKLKEVNEDSLNRSAWRVVVRNTDVDVGRFLNTTANKVSSWIRDNKDDVELSKSNIKAQILEFVSSNDHTVLESSGEEIRRHVVSAHHPGARFDIHDIIDREIRRNVEVVNEARQLKYAYEQERYKLIKQESIRVSHLRTPGIDEEHTIVHGEAPQETPEERRLGKDMGDVRYFARGLSGVEESQSLPIRKFDVDTIVREGTTRDHQVTLQQLQTEYGSQLNSLKSVGFITETDETKIIRTLQLARESNFELGVFELGNGREITLTKPQAYEESLRHLTGIQRMEVSDFIREHNVDPTRASFADHLRAQFGTTSHILGIIGGVGTLSTDAYSYLLAEKKSHAGGGHGSSSDIAVQGLGPDEYGAADVTATHEALVESLTEADAPHILSQIRTYAATERLSEPGIEPSVQVEMYKVVSELIAGQIEPKDVNIPESFVRELRLNREESLQRIQNETKEATESALNSVTRRHPEWAQQLEAHGAGSSKEEKMLDAVDKLLDGNAGITMPPGFIEEFESSRRTALQQMPETSLIGAIDPGQAIPISIGLRARDLAGTQQMLTLIKQQDEDVQRLQHVSDSQKEAFFSYLNRESLVQAEHAGIPESLRSLFHGQATDTNPHEAIALLSLADSIGDHQSNHHFKEQQEFMHNYLRIRQRILDEYMKRSGQD